MNFVNEKQARIVSLVPSWTETLIWAGLNVVGRTRFCVHPEDQVKSIPALGGTKGVDIQRLVSLKPDYVILDQEENKKEMADQLVQSGIKILVSHVSDFQTAAQFLQQAAMELHCEKLAGLADRYLKLDLVDQTLFLEQILLDGDFEDLGKTAIEYIIWKNPYMVIGKKTFISEVLNLANLRVTREEKYPQVLEEELKKSFCFFSSEPYPFKKDFSKLIESGFKGALIDGEKVSWYGIRNLSFLEACVR